MKNTQTSQNKLSQKRKHKFPQAKHGQREIVELKTQHKNTINSEKSRGKTTPTGEKKFKTEKPYLLVDDFELKRVKQWRSKMEARLEWTRANEEDNEQSQKDRGKNILKTALISAKHAIFATGLSRHTVASSSRQSIQEQNFEKFF